MESYQLTRSKRKSISIVIEKNGSIQVKAPNWLPKYKIDQFIQQKADWIQEKQREILMMEQRKPAHTFREGDSFLFQGETYRLAFGPRNWQENKEGWGGSTAMEWMNISRNWQENKDGWGEAGLAQIEESLYSEECAWRGELSGSAEIAEKTDISEKKQFSRIYKGTALDEREKHLFIELDPSSDTDIVKKKIEEWYFFQAKQLFPERVSQYYPLVSRLAEHSGREISSVNRISIRNQKTRWGSCSNKGNLNFNWRLVMAPAEILDYVVVHELCHLAYLNHSSQFWQLVGSILPDCRERRSWLKANGPLLEWE